MKSISSLLKLNTAAHTVSFTFDWIEMGMAGCWIILLCFFLVYFIWFIFMCVVTLPSHNSRKVIVALLAFVYHQDAISA